ncbi:hypothetical protein DHEL01_v203576 [Diaporthe helianthi]|uniref:Uncharacterized protein n=1 Tax=Diaporthe helianthi TaxID=158607 RepID=A0A2P5I684_DIAHE|nr:hypothetical protein DHEL01_v203576 [Diaporthe helianthi]
MPRFAFGKRKSTAESENDIAAPSFRVLDRSEVAEGNGKSFDGGVRLSAKTHTLPKTTVSDISVEDNIFADFKPKNRGSGSSNTTKTNSTDNSSRHSAASTAPSSADLNGQDDWRLANKKPLPDATQQPSLTKPGPSGFLKSAGRSWSFGASKKQLPAVPAGEEDVPITPAVPEQYKRGRARATTGSTDSTVTPPKVDQAIGFDLGGSFSKMLLGFDKRSSAMTLKDENGRQVLQPSAPTGGRLNAPSPIHIDHTSKVEPPPHSWASHHSNDNLLTGSPRIPSPAKENAPPPVPAHGEPQSRPRGPGHSSSENLLKRTSAIFSGRRKSISNALETSEGDDLNTSLLAVNRFLSDANSRSQTPVEVVGGQYRRNEDTSGPGYRVVSPPTVPPKLDSVDDDDNMFDNVPLNSERFSTPRQPAQKAAPKAAETPAKNKTMTVSEFEQYRKDREVEERRAEVDKAREETHDDEDEDEINYDDDEDEAEKSKQLAKQRRKQEAHMTVYRQQMMKVTGESPDAGPSRPSMPTSLSTPNLVVPDVSRNSSSEVSEDDEEVPLAILAAHGFPNKNRPPTRLTNMMSNPNLRQAAQPSFQRPGSAAGHNATASGSLPPFARGLPQDPYGLVNAPPRESFALGGGAPAGQNSSVPPGGLVGVIANEERSRAMRRGSPQVAQMDHYQGMQQAGPGGFDPMQGIPQQMMYPQQPPMPMLSPNEQAQLQLNQQMSQFMQMQMQFMQMMAGNNNNGNNNFGNGPPRTAGHMGTNSMGAVQGVGGPGMGIGMPMGMDMNGGPRGSYLETPMMDQSMGEMHGRTMSMVQPSSSSWLQAPQPGYAGSIRQQTNGYTPSIAPSERSNVGLPGRYRPVSQMPSPGPAIITPDHTRQSSMMASTLSPFGDSQTLRPVGANSPKKSDASKSSASEDADDDDEEGWAAMKAKRDKKKSSWKTRKTMAPGGLDIGSLIT